MKRIGNRGLKNSSRGMEENKSEEDEKTDSLGFFVYVIKIYSLAIDIIHLFLSQSAFINDFDILCFIFYFDKWGSDE